MTFFNKLLKITTFILGILSISFFAFDYVIFSQLRPKMVDFQAISLVEENLFNWVGIGLLIFLVFCLLSLWRLVAYLKKVQTINWFSLFLLVSGVLSLVFVFGDVALIGDIGKQYKNGWSQPEWSILYWVIAGQFVTSLVFTGFHACGNKKQLSYVARDSNIFSIVQVVGIVCGLLGLSFSSLGFFFPRAWMLGVHTTATSIILLTPYILAVFYWLVTKLQEKHRQWYDEKQLADVGKSAFLTLIISVIFMVVLFFANYSSLGGVVSILWLPLYLFWVLLLFSAGNWYFNNRS